MSDSITEEIKKDSKLFGLIVVALWAMFQVAWWLLPGLRADIYDLLIIKMTRVWYKCVLDRCEGGARVLDVGIGTATALVKNKEILERKNIFVVGLDYEQSYIEKAGRVVSDAGLAKRVKLNCTSVYEPRLRSLFTGAARFDVVYFSGSLTLMPDPAAALKCTAAMLSDNGRIYVTQTFQNRPSLMMERVKPLLRRFTSVDFGKVTYHKEVLDIVDKAGLAIVEDSPIPGSIDNANQTARMLILKPTAATKSH